jgi:N-carbamoyl-L-amino-acid hydrolase
LNPLSAHFELHIEQGPRLATHNDRVGVVTGIQGNRRFQVHVKGEKAHAGSTPMLRRTDALVASAKVILLIEETAVTHGGFATVGVIECENSSTNCVPAEVFFTIDIRNPTEENLNLMEQSIRARMSELENNTPKLLFDIEKIWESPAARFKEAAVQCVRAHAIRRFGTSSVAELDSFAGHDSAMTNLRVPTAMIFVPSRDGISHSPEEYTSESQW